MRSPPGGRSPPWAAGSVRAAPRGAGDQSGPLGPVTALGSGLWSSARLCKRTGPGWAVPPSRRESLKCRGIGTLGRAVAGRVAMGIVPWITDLNLGYLVFRLCTFLLPRGGMPPGSQAGSIAVLWGFFWSK